MSERSVVVRLRADISDLKSKMLEGRKAVEDFAKRTSEVIDKNSASIDKLSNTAGVIGLTMAAAAGATIAAWAGFDKQMSAVQAATHATSGEMDALSAAAIKAGADTVYTATESAAAIENLAKAGISTSDILGGGLTGSLSLAAAGGIAVADAADIAATAMTQFGLTGDKVSHVADLLSAGANKAQGGVADMGMALKQSGLVASQFGLSIEETVGTLTAFASAGLLGSDAGTSFRTMLLHLANPTDAASNLMQQLGINAYNTAGQFVGMANLAAQLQERLSGLTQAQRDQALAQIFGMDAIRGANVLMKDGSKGINEWIGKVNEQGYAAETAAIRLNNLSGDVEQLKGSLEAAAITMGSTADGPMRLLTQAATGLVNELSTAPASVQAVTLAIAGGGGLVLLAGTGVAKLVMGFRDLQIATEALGISMKTVALSAAGIGVALAVGTLAITNWAQKAAEARAQTDAFKGTLDSLGNTTDQTMSLITDALSKNRDGMWDWATGGHVGSIIDMQNKLGLSTADLTGYILKQPAAIDRVSDALAKNGRGGDLTIKQIAVFSGVLEDLSGQLTTAQKETLQKAQADLEAGGAADTNTQAIIAQAQAQEQATAAQTEALQKWREEVAKSDSSFVSLTGAYDAVIQKNRDLAEQTAASTKSSKDSWKDYYDGVTVTGDDLIAEMTRQVTAQQQWEQNLFDILSRARADLPPQVQAAVDEMINDLANLGPEGAQQVQLLHDMSDDQLLQVVKLYGERGAQAAGDFAAQLQNAINAKPPVIDVSANLTPANDQIQAWLEETRRLQVGSAARPGKPVARASGGILPGPPSSVDNMTIRAASGEFVVNAAATSKHLGTLQAINSGTYSPKVTAGYATGEMVGFPAAQASVYAAAVPSWTAAYRPPVGGADPRELTVNQKIVTSDPTAAAMESIRLMRWHSII